ncbi:MULTISPECIES: AAA family ATPase [Streptomyces]|uniref:AAA family ATPase n=1 Tax=Streptomyces TaxID=1883 RepID=UPI00240D3CA2|nr:MULTISPECIES: AAA family ATPase [Streptomyces]WFB83823.1 TniB family NTP-binding protein [Streptomyces olivaceus]WGK50557.1 TniB family NTP-binding protein [Streptomyces sp. B146]
MGRDLAQEAELLLKEERLLRDMRVPEQFFLAPPVPDFPEDCHAWRAKASARIEPPDLADSAPHGTNVTEFDTRLLWHGHMRTVRSPAIITALLAVTEVMRANQQREYGRIGMMVDGPRGTGKSTLLQAIAMYWERRFSKLYGPDENRIPVVALSVPPLPVRGTQRDWAGAFARFLGQERASANLTESVIRTMRSARTQMVVIDGIERLRSAPEAEAALQYLEMICEDTGATFIYCGRGAQNIVDPYTRDNDTLLDLDEMLRGDHPVLRLGRMGFDDEGVEKFQRVLGLFDADLRLWKHERGDLLDIADYLHTRSRGYMRMLSHLICQGAQLAIRTQQERITQDLLEKVTVGRTVEL